MDTNLDHYNIDKVYNTSQVITYCSKCRGKQLLEIKEVVREKLNAWNVTTDEAFASGLPEKVGIPFLPVASPCLLVTGNCTKCLTSQGRIVTLSEPLARTLYSRGMLSEKVLVWTTW